MPPDTPWIWCVVSFLDAIAEWGWAEAPARRLVFLRDAPMLPHPLPRYLPPDAERALLRALEGSPNRLRRRENRCSRRTSPAA